MKNILPLLADWANGIFAILITSQLFGIEPEWWYFLVGILFAMSPDIDALPELLSRGKVSASAEYQRDHRTFLHFPVISLPLALLLAWYFGFWGVVWLIAVVLHLVNDLYGTGWGLALMYPISTNHYKFLARRVNQSPALLFGSKIWESLPVSEKKLRFVVTWSQKEIPIYIKKYGMDNWIDHCYLTLNPIPLVEYSLFLIALVLMLFTLL